MPDVSGVERRESTVVLVLLDLHRGGPSAVCVKTLHGRLEDPAVEAPVDLDHVPRKVRGPVREEEGDQIGDLLGLS